MLQTRAPRDARGRLAGLHILIAEDTWLIADTLSVLLEEEGAHIVGPTPTEAEAISLLDSETVNFALIDMSLRDEFADKLVEQVVSRDIPFVVITGFDALPSNADEQAVWVFRKPIDREALIELLAGYTGSRA